jgi:general secretion pathway protein A
MYWETLGFKEPPFALTPNPEFLFMSSHHQEAFAHLLFAIDTRAGFIELSGEVGTGKTTIIRTLLGQLSPETHRSAFIFNPMLSALGLLQEINREFGLSSHSTETHELHKTLNEFLLKENGTGHKVVLVIDEAQNLSPEVLEQVRLISNLETEQEKLIQIVLVGQPELQQLLNRQELRQLNQRITVRYHLQPMEPSDVHSYIRHRIRVASGGGEPVTFTASAAAKINRYSGGVPRLVNAVCDRALLLAYTREIREISPTMVKDAIADLAKTEPKRTSILIKAAVVITALIAVIVLLATFYNRPSLPETVRQQVDTANPDGVTLLQTMLKQAGHFEGSTNGVFDTKTEDAVKKFQLSEGLFVDGKPGEKTLVKLYLRVGGKLTVDLPPSTPSERSNPR